jgi:hypothetical protein
MAVARSVRFDVASKRVAGLLGGVGDGFAAGRDVFAGTADRVAGSKRSDGGQHDRDDEERTKSRHGCAPTARPEVGSLTLRQVYLKSQSVKNWMEYVIIYLPVIPSNLSLLHVARPQM